MTANINHDNLWDLQNEDHEYIICKHNGAVMELVLTAEKKS